MNRQLLLYHSKGKTLLLGVFCIGSLGLSIWVIFQADAPTYHKIILGFLVPLLAIFTVFSLYKLVNPQPSVVVTEKGIFDNSTLVSCGWIYWNEIASFSTYKKLRQAWVGISLKDPKAFIKRQSKFKRWILTLSLLMGRPIVQIPMSILSKDTQRKMGILNS